MHVPKMKTAFLGFLAAASLCACGGKGRDGGTAPHTDSLPAAAVATDTGAPDAEPPAVADELFDDFIYGFTKNEKFQRRRVRFPLPRRTDGKDELVTAGQWKFDRLFSDQDVYTMIFNDERAARQENDTTVDRVAVEWIDLLASRVKQYLFERTRGRWMLTAIDAHALAADDNREFYSFYHRFVSDSVYQRRHVKNPLPFTTYDEDEFLTVEGWLDIDQWYAFRPALPDGIITNINYGMTDLRSDKRIFVISSQSGGMNCTLTFRRANREWTLVRLEN